MRHHAWLRWKRTSISDRAPPAPAATVAGSSPPGLAAIAPMLFVSIWATGFLVARLVAGHADPFTFLTIRFALGAAAFAIIARMAKVAWPRPVRLWRNSAIAGILLQAAYLGGVFWAVRAGLPAAVCALITGLQPLLTASLAGPMLGERVPPRQWAGIVIGFTGAVLVLAPQITSAPRLALAPIAAAALAMLAITGGTIWQKRIGAGIDLRAGAAIQFAAAAIVTLPVALLTERGAFDASWQAWLGLGWAVGGLSVGAITLLLVLISRNGVASVASLFYLVPPVVALLAFLLFGDVLTTIQIAGMIVAATGVAIATRP